MNRTISTDVTETVFIINIKTPYTKTEIFGFFDNTVFIITNDTFAHHLAESLYSEEDMDGFLYGATDKRVVMRITMKPGHNFFELDFTMFNWNLLGEESQHFIWE